MMKQSKYFNVGIPCKACNIFLTDQDRKPDKVASQLRFEVYCSAIGVEFRVYRSFDSTRDRALEQVLLRHFHCKWFANQGTKVWTVNPQLKDLWIQPSASPPHPSSRGGQRSTISIFWKSPQKTQRGTMSLLTS